MKTYLRRWYVVNSLYRLLRRRGNGMRWAREYDLCAWIAGVDLNTAPALDRNGNLLPDPTPIHFYWPLSNFFDAKTHDDLYGEIRNIVQECTDPDVNWIVRNEDDGFNITIRLSTKGREVYPVSHLVGIFFGNYYVKWATTLLVVWCLAHWFNFYIQPK